MRRLFVSLAVLASAGCTSLPAPVLDALDAARPNASFLVDSDAEDGIASSTVLQEGRAYTVTVEGTFSYWKASDWRQGSCGEPDPAPRFASGAGSPVGSDAAFVFAAPQPTRFCRGDLPAPRSGWRYRVTSGGEWQQPQDPQTYRSDHRYTYRIVGAGAPLTIRVEDDAHRDNSGALRVTIQEVE